MVPIVLIALIAAGPSDADPELGQIVREAAAQLETIRGQTFAKPVPARRQSKEEFGAFLNEEIGKEYPAEAAANEARALIRLGLLPAGFDLRGTLERALASQVAAYYDPESKAFFVVQSSPFLDRIVAVHELTHALQDQRFDLEKKIEEARRSGSDRELAFTFIVEGEAVYTMTAAMMPQLPEAMEDELLDKPLRMQANLTRKEIEAMNDAGQFAEETTGLVLGAAGDLGELPDLLFRSLVDPYLKGPLVILEARERGGWEAVDDLFRNPPRSTEQVLHPEKLWGDALDEPTAVEIPDLCAALPAGWRKIHQDVLGEFGMQVMLAGLAVPPPAPAGADIFDRIGEALKTDESAALAEKGPAGWDGDRFVAYARGDETFVALSTVWDSETDAVEFARAIVAVWKRGGADVILVDDERGGAHLADGTRNVLERRGSCVHVLIGIREDLSDPAMHVLRSSERRRDGGTAREADF
ncbi:MAG: hypothetical protein JXP34_12320 [Planctomycetes bacterium]|nr:hypothetical protein [Planctomycetota bacterium]